MPPTAIDEIKFPGWFVPGEDVCLPVLTLNEAAFSHNLAVMDNYAAQNGVYLCPHGKTIMSPDLLSQILECRRTVGLCTATITQARVLAEMRCPTILIANEVVGRSNVEGLAWLIDAFPDTRFLSIVDSVASLEVLTRQANALPSGVQFQILIEVGYRDARTGVRNVADLHNLIVALREMKEAGSRLRLCGVEAYEGSITGTHEDRKVRISEYIAFALETYEVLLVSGLGLEEEKAPVFTAGGSSTFDIVTNAYNAFEFSSRPPLWLRGGVASIYDHRIYRERLREMDERNGFVLNGETTSAVETFRPALSLWAVVQSLPQPGMVILAAGLRDFPHDAGLPIVLEHWRDGSLVRAFDLDDTPFIIEKAMDHHAYLSPLPNVELFVGDVIRLGISHPCTAFDHWRFVLCTDENHRVTRVVETFF